MRSGTIIGVNGSNVPAYVIELEGGLRIRFTTDDWERLTLFRGQRVPIRLTGKSLVWATVWEFTDTPPIRWVVFVQQYHNRAS